MTQWFVPLEDIKQMSRTLAADARRTGDEAGADAIEFFASEIEAAVKTAVWQLDVPSENGAGA